jgi:hypothetical protein
MLGTDAILEFELDLRLFDDVFELDCRRGRHYLIRGLFAGSGATLLRLVRRKWGLGKAENAPQQAKDRLGSEREFGGSSRITDRPHIRRYYNANCLM